jgi:surface polysaccharide O-acyltransferase-like enzyme
MPLMMLMAGMTIWYSLRKRTVGEFVRERITRLFVPFLTGLVIVFPPQVYYHLKSEPPYQEGFIQFLKRFWHVEFSLSAFPTFIKDAPPDGVLENVSYLWFLIYLFVYTLLLLPLLRYLLTPAGRRWVERLAAFFARRRAIFLLALPIGIVEAALTTEFPGSWNRFVWLLPIIYGFVFASDERFDQALVRHRRSALALGLVSFLIYFMGMGMLTQIAEVDPFVDRDPGSMLVRFIKGVAGWCWVVAVMGIATHWGQRRAQQMQTERMHKPSLMDRVLAYGHEARLPFYVLHELPIIVIGYYVVQWNANALVKYLVISFSAVVATLLLYDIGVRRIPVTRFLFGMRPKRKPRLEATPVEELRRPTLASVD